MSVVALCRSWPNIDNLMKIAIPIGRNMGLITVGCFFYIIGMKSVMIPAGLFAGWELLDLLLMLW